jgi:putative SOS response-associated peptidase YedK
MCGRFALIASTEMLLEQFALSPAAVPTTPSLFPRYNIAPTQAVAAIRLALGSGVRELAFFRWGLIPSWSKDIKIGSRLINARSETVREKASFRVAFKRRRCLIPADGFYEWQRQGNKKQPMYIHSNEHVPFGLAGLWETWHAADGSAIDSCTILTTEPNELMQPIHNRMPVIIDRPDYDLWLHPDPSPDAGLHLLRPYPASRMVAYPVSTAVNNPSNDDPQCIVPLS